MEIANLVGIFFVGVFSSFIGAMVGSGGLVSIPFLIFFGLPPQVAIATHKFGATGLKLGALTKFSRTPHIKWVFLVPFSLLGLVGAFLGSEMLLRIDEELLSRIVSILLLVTLPIIFIKKDIGVVNQVTSRVKKFFGYITYFLAQVFAAFFGGGAATIVIQILVAFFGLTIIEASATAMLPSLITTLTALVIFGLNGLLDFQFGMVLFIGMLIGGWLGAHFAIKKGNAWIKTFFAIIVILLAVKMLLFR